MRLKDFGAIALMAVMLTALVPATASACHSQTVSCDNASWTDDDMSPDSVSITPAPREVPPGGSTEYHIEMYLSPGCGNQYYLYSSLGTVSNGWSATFTDGPGRTGKDLSYNENMLWGSGSVVVNGYLNITAPAQAPEGASADIVVTIGADDNARNDKDIVYVKTNTRVHTPNPPPFVQNALVDFSINEDTMDTAHINLAGVFRDPNSDPLMYRARQGANITVSVFQDGKVTLMPKKDWSGVESLVFYASDGFTEASDTVLVTVKPVDDAPLVAAPLKAFAIPKDGEDGTSINLNKVFYDPDKPYGDKLTFSYGGNVNISITIKADGRVDLKPLAGWAGKETIVFTATDSDGHTASDSVDVTITDTSRPPSLKSPIPDISFPEDSVHSALDLAGHFTDPDLGTQFQYGVEGNSYINVTIKPSGAVTLTPRKDWNGAETLSFWASDGLFSPVYDDMLVTVTPVNDPPYQKKVFSISFKEDSSSSPVFLDSYFTDTDGDKLTYSASSTDDLTIQISSKTSEMTVGSKLNFNGDTGISLTASDGKEPITVQVPVHIIPVDDLPVFTEAFPPGNAVCTEGDDMSFSAEAFDIDGDRLSYMWSVDGYFNPLRLSEGKNAVRFRATAENDFGTGQHELTIWATTASGAVPHSWSITVKQGNRPPSIPVIRSPLPDQNLSASRPIEFSAFSEDLEGDQISYNWSIDGTDITGQQFAQKLPEGIHVLRVRAVDSWGAASGVQEMTITVNKAPAQPVPAGGGLPASSLYLLLSLAVGLGVVGFIGGTELGIYAFFSFLVFLYSKIDKEEILDNFTRGKIYGYIVANPGDHYNSIMNALKLRNGTFAYHLRRLEDETLIKSVSNGLLKRFYPVEMRVDENKASDNLTRIQRIVFDIIVETPGISQKDISGVLNVSNATVNFHTDALMKKGFIKRERAGYKVRYYPIRQEAGNGNGNGNGAEMDVAVVAPPVEGQNGSEAVDAPLVK